MTRDAVTSPSIDRDEHDYKIDAKKVTLWGYNAATDTSTRLGGLGKLVTEPFDYIGAAYPDTVTEVYTYKTGGSGGTTVATITVVYTDSSKNFVSTVART